MLTRTQAKEILQTLQALPADKLAEVYDYMTFLRERYGQHPGIDVSDVWSDEDINDFMATSLGYADHAI